MNFLSNRIVALLLWLMPILLLGIAIALLLAGLEQRQVAESGTLLTADVLEIDTQERSEISRGHLHLRYTLPQAAQPTERTVELPMTYLKDIEASGREQIQVRVIGDRGQVVLADHGRGQWIMTLSFAAMSLLGALGLGWMVGAWNLYLKRHGDPAVMVDS
jgi:hypothetical protein